MNILTFDIEDWFHTHQNRKSYSGHIWEELPSRVIENTKRILILLEKHELKATFFVLGWVAKYYPSVVKMIYSKGHEIGAHSYWHHNPHFISHSDFEKDLKLCLDTIEDITGQKVIAYRAPGFNLNLKDDWAFDILAEYGIKIDSSVQISKMPSKIPIVVKGNNNTIIEFPLITTCFGLPFSGGGYFRALPFNYIKYLFEKRSYNLLYFHPRDFDPENPFTNLFSFFRNLLNRINTGKCENRLEYILENNKTNTLESAASSFIEIF